LLIAVFAGVAAKAAAFRPSSVASTNAFF
jgi:hypothetical protein